MESIKQTAEKLKVELQKYPRNRKLQLVDFANSYSKKKDLRFKAIMLSSSYERSINETIQNQLKKEMVSLVNDIVLDYESSHLEELRKPSKKLNKKSEIGKTIVYAKGLGAHYKESGFHMGDINLDLKLGEITGLVGKNGSGKTTLIKLIVGEINRDEGELTYPSFPNTDIEHFDWHEIKKNIAYVPQELPKWYGSLKINLQFEAAMRGISPKENKVSVDYIVQRLGLEEHLQKSWDELSGGFKLRFALAKALVWNPKLLVIDEPLGNLDLITQKVLLRDLRDLAKSHRYPVCVFISSQHVFEIESICNNILFLKKGKAIFQGDVNSIGNSKDQNIFEFNTNLSFSELRERLVAFPSLEIRYDGFIFLIISPQGLSRKKILSILLKNDVEIIYFKDISNSVKRLFDER